MAVGLNQASSASARDLLAAALQLHQQGNLSQAESGYLRVLGTGQGAMHSDALHLLGVLRGQQGDVAGAIALIEQAIAGNPRFSAYHNNLGNLRKRAGDAGGAESSYRRAIALDARNGEAYLNLGKLLQEAGDRAAARQSFVKALPLAPQSVEAQMSMGRLEEAEGDLPAAIARYREAAHLAPEDPAPALMLGRALTASGDIEQAETSLRHALALDPAYADAYYNLGVLEHERKHFPQAASLYRTAIELAPLGDAAADCWNNLGVTLSKQGERQAALAAYLKATELRPGFDGAFHNLGKEALKLGAEKAAEKYFRGAIELNPNSAAALHDLGAMQQAQGLLDEAAESYRLAIAASTNHTTPAFMELAMNLEGLLALTGDRAAVDRLGALTLARPDFPEGRFNWSMALLLHGVYDPGWQEYEFRRQVAWLSHNYRPLDSTPQPLWDGSPLNGRTLLLHAEQGFGDTLQMVRYLPLVCARAGAHSLPASDGPGVPHLASEVWDSDPAHPKTGRARVLLEVQPALKRLLEGLPGIDCCIAAREPVPAFDTYLPLMSLPHVFGTTAETIPPPFSPPVPSRATTPGRCNVGLVWAGNPSHSRDRLRSVSLEALRPLAAIEGVTFTSLQTGVPTVQIATHGAPFRFAADCSGVRDFADTAQIIAGLDLVITIDSAVAHLTGSLGKPVWILLANAPDWRWGLGRSDTPWYPSARLFRQQRSRDWPPVIAEVAACLTEFAASRRTCVTPRGMT